MKLQNCLFTAVKPKPILTYLLPVKSEYHGLLFSLRKQTELETLRTKLSAVLRLGRWMKMYGEI